MSKKVVIPVRAGRLSELGYATDMQAEARRKILMKAVKDEGDYLPVYRHLIARATQHKVHPEIAKVFRADAKWLKQHFRKYDIAYDLVTGKWLPYVPEPMDFEFDGVPVVVRFVPELELVEVAVGVPQSDWIEMTHISTKYANVERPSERIIFRSHRGVKVNLFLDNLGD